MAFNDASELAEFAATYLPHDRDLSGSDDVGTAERAAQIATLTPT